MVGWVPISSLGLGLADGTNCWTSASKSYNNLVALFIGSVNGPIDDSVPSSGPSFKTSLFDSMSTELESPDRNKWLFIY